MNKTDLRYDEEIRYWISLYSGLGYKVYETQAVNSSGISEIKNTLKNSTSVFWGASGVGKSSLLTAMFSELNLRIGEISESSNKGKHTTVTSVLLNPEEGVSIIDTPGIREIEPFGIKKEDLGHYFREFTGYLNNCRFNTCTHNHEPGCAVYEAAEREKISLERYESYLNLLETIEDDMFF